MRLEGNAGFNEVGHSLCAHGRRGERTSIRAANEVRLGEVNLVYETDVFRMHSAVRACESLLARVCLPSPCRPHCAQTRPQFFQPPPWHEPLPGLAGLLLPVRPGWALVAAGQAAPRAPLAHLGGAEAKSGSAGSAPAAASKASCSASSSGCLPEPDAVHTADGQHWAGIRIVYNRCFCGHKILRCRSVSWREPRRGR